MDRENKDANNEARRLRELFKGRFDQDTAVKLITELGGLLPALDFLFNEDEEQVSRFLKTSTSYLQSLRDDSKTVASLLENKLESNLRQFVCGDCKKSWWKKVPVRKEVSKCKTCKAKYDPLPREHEFGLGLFKCSCGNEFSGFACMGETRSECYSCHEKVLVDSVTAPRRKHGRRKSKNRHSCNGVNCFNSNHNHGQSLTDISQLGSQPGADLDRYMTTSAVPQILVGMEPGGIPGGRSGGIPGGRPGGRPNQSDYTQIQGNNVPADPVPVCVHPKSQKRALKYVSQKHKSTGSTVSTFLSQSSIETQSISVISALYSIDE